MDPGAEASGTVLAVGDSVDIFSVGDRVFGSPGFSGGYAEQALLAADRVAHAPRSIDMADAAAAVVGAATALEGLDDHLAIAPGQRLLVAGASGGVGSFVVQIAKARGATVVATASAANHDDLRSIGSDEVVDYRGDWESAVGRVDAAFDCVGGDTWTACVGAVRDGGRAVTILPTSPLDSTRPVSLSTYSATMSAARLRAVAELIDSGKVQLEIAARLPLEEAAKAHELIETRHTRGKILLLPR